MVTTVSCRCSDVYGGETSGQLRTADVNRFLVVCALVSDLYCPSYNPRQSLEKNSNLAQAVSRYKIDTAKVATNVRAELSKTKNKANDERQPTKKSNTVKSPHPKRS